MKCPKCGAEMNRHAEKLVHPGSITEARQADPALGGFIEETYACPVCGNIESRRI
jgi:predicted RNA-binding Zn-ribbon protein involved in translation (DUF1610 family)